ncbi:MAG: DNA repair exonuclease [Clostridia bacterium]|nr:DNA repair exonuclease [Clostridia bacterium]
MIRLLHLGDLHLGSPFSAFSPRAAATRRARQLEALEKLLAQALSQGVQLLLFAGDCFDTNTPDPDTVRRFFALLGKCGVPVVIAPGNHDPYLSGGLWDSVPLPQNVCLFQESELAFFALEALGVNVYGYAFTGDTHAAPALVCREDLPLDRINILLAHADIMTPDSAYAPLTAGALAASGFAYAALGHIHKRTDPRRFGDTVAAYSGFFAGRGFDEVGAGNVNLVEIDGARVTVTPIETAADRFEIYTLDCTGDASGEDVRQRAASFLQNTSISKGSAVRLVLCGEVGVSCTPDRVAISRLGEEYALFEVRDETLPVYDKAFLEKDPGLRGAFYRAMQRRLESEDPSERAVAAEALRVGLAALSGRELL